MTPPNPSRQEAARRYLAQGWAVIPVPARSKNAGRTDWQLERWTLDDVPTQFRGNGNLSLLPGTPSLGIGDVDVDCADACGAHVTRSAVTIAASSLGYPLIFMVPPEKKASARNVEYPYLFRKREGNAGTSDDVNQDKLIPSREEKTRSNKLKESRFDLFSNPDLTETDAAAPSQFVPK